MNLGLLKAQCDLAGEYNLSPLNGLSDLRSAVPVAKLYGFSLCLPNTYQMGQWINTIISDFVYIASGDSLLINTSYVTAAFLKDDYFNRPTFHIALAVSGH